MTSRTRKMLRTKRPGADSSAAPHNEALASLLELPKIKCIGDFQKGNYRSLKKGKIHVDRRFDWDLLADYGLRENLETSLRDMGWLEFAHLEPECCPNLVQEFLSSLHYVSDATDTLGYRIANMSFQFTKQEMSHHLHLPLVTNPIPSPADDTQEAWRIISESDVPYSNNIKASNIRSDETRLLHRWITISMNGRHLSHDAVSVEDIVLLMCFRNKWKVNGVNWLLRRWMEQVEAGRKHICGSYITELILKLQPSIPTCILTFIPYKKPTHNIGTAGLSGLNLIALYQTAERRKPVWLRIPEDGVAPPGYTRVPPRPRARHAPAVAEGDDDDGSGDDDAAEDDDEAADPPAPAHARAYDSDQMAILLQMNERQLRMNERQIRMDERQIHIEETMLDMHARQRRMEAFTYPPGHAYYSTDPAPFSFDPSAMDTSFYPPPPADP